MNHYPQLPGSDDVPLWAYLVVGFLCMIGWYLFFDWVFFTAAILRWEIIAILVLIAIYGQRS